MIKKTLISIYALWVGSYSYSLQTPRIYPQPQKVPSLQALNTKHLFFFNTKEEKQALNRKLTTDPLFRERLRFDGLLIENLDLSKMCLKDIDFRGCVFKSVKFSGSDLKGCKFKRCEFDECDFKNTILYYSSDVVEEKVSIEGFKVTDWNPLALVKLYSSLIQESKLKQEDKVSNEALAKSRCLNKFFPGLKLWLGHTLLRDLDLTDINLENASLESAQLQGTRLSDKVTIPNYKDNNRSKLFLKWVEGDPEEQEVYQMLANTRFDLATGVEHTKLVEGIEKKKKNLKNVFLYRAHLKGVDLSQANLQNAFLMNAHLEGVDLSQANLQNADLDSVRLEEADLKEANLQNAKLYEAHLEGTDLRKANLQNAKLWSAHLEGADLNQANLQNASLFGAHLEGANLKGTIIAGARLSSSFRLPLDCKDENLMGIYETCNDPKAKDLLKDILKAKGMLGEKTQ